MSKRAWVGQGGEVVIQFHPDSPFGWLSVEEAKRLQYDLRHAIEEADPEFDAWWATLQQANGTCGLMKLVAPKIAMSKEQAYPVWKAARKGL